VTCDFRRLTRGWSRRGCTRGSSRTAYSARAQGVGRTERKPQTDETLVKSPSSRCSDRVLRWVRSGHEGGGPGALGGPRTALLSRRNSAAVVRGEPRCVSQHRLWFAGGDPLLGIWNAGWVCAGLGRGTCNRRSPGRRRLCCGPRHDRGRWRRQSHRSCERWCRQRLHQHRIGSIRTGIFNVADLAITAGAVIVAYTWRFVGEGDGPSNPI